MLWCVTGNGRLRIFWNTRQNATGVNRTGGGEGCMGWEGQEMGHFRGMPPLSGNLKVPRNSQAFLLKAHYAGLLS